MPQILSITDIAESFFQTGKGWAVSKQYCAPSATFAAQAEPLLDTKPWSNTQTG